MKNTFGNGRYGQKYISPNLQKLFLHFNKKPKIKNLKEYIKLLNLFVSVHINYACRVLYEMEEKPIASTHDLLTSLDALMAEALRLVTDIAQECRGHYCLTFREEKMLNYAQNKAEYAWSHVDKLLCEITEAYESLFYDDNDFVAEEVPYKVDYSEIMAIPISLN